MKKLLFTTILIMFLAIDIFCQSYEYLIFRTSYAGLKGKIEYNYEGQDIKVAVSLNDIETKMQSLLNEFSQKGWELQTFSGASVNYVIYIMKKEKTE